MMRRKLILLVLGMCILPAANLLGQEDYFKSAPFSSGVMTAQYLKSGKSIYCDIHFDNYGERYTADLKESKEDTDVFKSILRKDGFLFYIIHPKKEVLKVPIKERILAFDTSQLFRISDTTYLNYEATYYNDGKDSIHAIYYGNLLLYLIDKYKKVAYRVNEINENESFPEFVFFLPRGFKHTEMNYNFAE